MDHLEILAFHYESTGLPWPTNEQIDMAPSLTFQELEDLAIEITHDDGRCYIEDAVEWKASEQRMLLKRYDDI